MFYNLAVSALGQSIPQKWFATGAEVCGNASPLQGDG